MVRGGERGGQQRKGTHWPGNYRPRYKMQIGELILDGWILGIQPVLRFRQLWSLCQVLWGLGLGNWGSLIFAELVGPIRILKTHDFAGKNTIFLLSFLFDLLVNFSNFSNVKDSCGIFGGEWAGNNYVVPFDFAQIRDCIVAESLALPRGHPPLPASFTQGF